MKKLYAPFPYFGGKRRAAKAIWDRLGDVDNYIEPFAGSLAVMLLRPHTPKIETANDFDCYLANFWRATQHDPEGVAFHADGPVNEVDLHARHRYLVLSADAAAFRNRMRTDPDFYDTKIAGWWCWGLCCWIGSGWCNAFGSSQEEPELGDNKVPLLGGGDHQYGHGVHAKGDTTHGNKMPSTNSMGVHTKKDVDLTQKMPRIDDGGVNSQGDIPEQLPKIGGHWGRDAINPPADTHRPQLADAYSRGRGVNGNDQAETCQARLDWLTNWFLKLRDRLRTVRVCCGDWERVVASPSVTVRLGSTAIFLDPPYSAEADRESKIYAAEDLQVAHRVREWCISQTDSELRICLAGYAGEGHEALEEKGWKVVTWKAQGGYGNRSEKGKANKLKERLWFSPACKRERTLFDEE